MKSKIHWYYGCGWGRPCRGDISPGQFLSDASKNPDWFCVTCAAKARLALAAESAQTEILGYCPDIIGWRRLSQMGRRWAPTGAEHIADYEPTHFLPLPPEVKG